MKFLIACYAQQRGLLVGLHKKFIRSNHSSKIFTRENESDFYTKTYDLSSDEVIDPASFDLKIIDVTELACHYEEKMSFRFSNIIAQDRGFGRGYLLNVTKYPEREQAKITLDEKLKYFITRLVFFEKLVLNEKPDLVFHTDAEPISQIVYNYYGVKFFNLGTARCSKNVMLYESCQLTSSSLEKSILGYLKSPELLDNYDSKELEIDPVANEINLRNDFTYFQALKDSIPFLKKDLRRIIAVRRKKTLSDYKLFTWVKFKFRRVKNYKAIDKMSVTPEEIPKNKNVLYFPLHLEPEIALMTISSEFSNTLEALSWLSKNLPSNYLIVLKEHSLSYGNRDLSFYKQLLEFSNVAFSKQQIHSFNWIKRSSIISTITGSVGFEGVLFKKPVISFGKHQVINLFPGVRYCNSFDSTQEAINAILSGICVNGEIHKKILSKSLEEASFALEGFQTAYKKKELQSDMAEELYNQIIKQLEFSHV